MNKEFRVWNPRTKEWLNDCWMYQSGKLDHDTIHSFDLQDCIVQKNTGLTDSTGKKIFEGDIVDYRYNGMDEFMDEFEAERMKDLLVSPVYWEEDRWRIKYSAASYAWHIMKVVGNFFENPELLK